MHSKTKGMAAFLNEKYKHEEDGLSKILLETSKRSIPIKVQTRGRFAEEMKPDLASVIDK